MKVYTEVNYIWKDDKLVQTDSKSYEYEGEVTRCDKRTREVCAFGYCKTVSVLHSHGTTSLAEVLPDNPADLINNALNLGGDVISGSVDLGLDVFTEVPIVPFGGMDLTDIMNVSTDIFGETGSVLGKAGLFTNDLINGVVNADWYGSEVGKHGLFGMGTPHLPILPSPNLEQFSGAGKLGENMAWLGEKLSGKGYLHDRINALSNWSMESMGHFWAWVGNIADYSIRDEGWGIELPLLSISTDGGGGDDGTSLYVKGRGTMKGRSPTLKLNKGGKGFGRKSLRIGTEGMGKPVGGKFQTYKSGRYTRAF